MDANTFTVTGDTARIKWGYYEAAVLAAWSIGADGRTLTAKVVSSDPLMVTQAPLTFVVPRPTGAWEWRIDSLQITGMTLSASLGS